MAVMNTILTFLLLLAAPDSLRTTPVSLTGGADAPRFWASLLGGGDFYLSRKVGDKARLSERTALVLSFFTTTCIPCRREIPLLDSLQTEFPQIDFFLVNIGEEPALVKNYVQKMQYKMPVLIDRYGQIAKKYQARQLQH
jgi:thiol-disulfide isomerase/thioredoxin